MSCGIYCIKNLIDNKTYIGQSVDIKRRFRKHKSCLRKNIHGNPYLQNSWNKYGEENFEFSIIEECKNDWEILNLKELYYIHTYNSFVEENNGYNLILGSNKGGFISEETRKRMSDSHKGKKQSQESINKMLYTRKNDDFHWSDERKKKLSDERRGKGNPRYGQTASDETKLKMGESQRKRRLAESTIP